MRELVSPDTDLTEVSLALDLPDLGASPAGVKLSLISRLTFFCTQSRYCTRLLYWALLH